MGVQEHCDDGEDWFAKTRASTAPADPVDCPAKSLKLAKVDSLGQQGKWDELSGEVPELPVECLQHPPDPRDAVVAVHLTEEGEV